MELAGASGCAVAHVVTQCWPERALLCARASGSTILAQTRTVATQNLKRNFPIPASLTIPLLFASGTIGERAKLD